MNCWVCHAFPCPLRKSLSIINYKSQQFAIISTRKAHWQISKSDKRDWFIDSLCAQLPRWKPTIWNESHFNLSCG